LLEIGIPLYLETRHDRAARSAQRNKTDAADALGIAHKSGLVPSVAQSCTSRS